MGYTTYFNGEFTLDQALTAPQAAYIKRFSGSRRMKRDSAIVEKFADPLREAVGLEVGTEGEHYVGTDETDKDIYKRDDPRYVKNSGEGFMNHNDPGHGGYSGQRHDASIIEYNSPSVTQPGLWCQWVPSEDGTKIVWDEGEKFYAYTAWLAYIIEHFLEPWGRTLNGEVTWEGEDHSDMGTIYVKDNKIEGVEDKITNPGPSWA